MMVDWEPAFVRAIFVCVFVSDSELPSLLSTDWWMLPDLAHVRTWEALRYRLKTRDRYSLNGRCKSRFERSKLKACSHLKSGFFAFDSKVTFVFFITRE